MSEQMSKTPAERALELVKKELSVYTPKQIEVVLELLGEGNTVPFIARYRKDKTGSLDEVQIREIEEREHYLEGLIKRKDEILRLIEEQEKLTPELQKKIEEAATLTRVEDLYRPYKQKRRTKATIAKEAGLEPLATWILASSGLVDLLAEARTYMNEEKGITTPEEALQGAHEIIAEMVGEEPAYRKKIREYTWKNGQIQATVKDETKDEKGVYENYYDYQESLKTIVPHRILAMNRAEKEEVIRVSLVVQIEPILQEIQGDYIKDPHASTTPYIQEAIEDSYKRFIGPAIEREIRKELSDKAEEQAIAIFGENLKHLLLQAPMKDQTILGLDPAYRTGCKLAVIDKTGKVLDKAVIYPHKGASDNKRAQAGPAFRQLLRKYRVNLVAIGNGTASRESEQFVAEQIKELDFPVSFTIVSEAGASVYSASDLARQEFPDYQVEERSAVSIARRLQDPLAELIKIDPKAVGVGQYQHDVSQKLLDERLDFVVETAVNKVGVNVNTASATLLQHIAGLTKTTAANVVAYRDENGSFLSRAQLKKVPRLGPKAFEQAIGFLRIIDGKNILDNTDIHPESYEVAKALLEAAQLSAEEVGTDKAAEALSKVNAKEFIKEQQIGKETYEILISGLTKPGRDPREEAAGPILRSDVLSMEDLQVGMELDGTVRNVVDFGAFVDIGVKQDGLVHISKLRKGFVKHPSDVVAVGDIVKVWVEGVELSKKRISLTMLEPTDV